MRTEMQRSADRVTAIIWRAIRLGMLKMPDMQYLHDAIERMHFEAPDDLEAQYMGAGLYRVSYTLPSSAGTEFTHVVSLMH